MQAVGKLTATAGPDPASAADHTVADPSEGCGSADAADAADTASIKHPYVCMLTFGHKHQMIVMLGQGPTLSDVRKTPEFKQAWGTEPVRLAFRKDVGQSALNLVSQMSRLSPPILLPPSLQSSPPRSPSVSPFYPAPATPPSLSQVELGEPSVQVLYPPPTLSPPPFSLFAPSPILSVC